MVEGRTTPLAAPRERLMRRMNPGCDGRSRCGVEVPAFGVAIVVGAVVVLIVLGIGSVVAPAELVNGFGNKTRSKSVRTSGPIEGVPGRGCQSPDSRQPTGIRPMAARPNQWQISWPQMTLNPMPHSYQRCGSPECRAGQCSAGTPRRRLTRCLPQLTRAAASTQFEPAIVCTPRHLMELRHVIAGFIVSVDDSPRPFPFA
jgi:hypothetical protein